MDKPNFIEIYSNIYSDTFCDRLIKYFDEASKMGFTINRQDFEEASNVDRADSAIFLPSEDFPLHSTNQDIYAEFNNNFWGKCYSEYVKKYGILSTLAEQKNYSIKIQKTKPGEGYHTWHCEQTNADNATRLLAWAVYLNDNFEAGETEFLYQHYRYKPKRGDVVIFPAAFTHTHRGNPPINGTKYIITGWIEF